MTSFLKTPVRTPARDKISAPRKLAELMAAADRENAPLVGEELPIDRQVARAPLAEAEAETEAETDSPGLDPSLDAG